MRRTAIIMLTCSFRARYPSNASTISSGIISTVRRCRSGEYLLQLCALHHLRKVYFLLRIIINRNPKRVRLGFWDRRNAKLFLGVNIGTQLLLTVVTAACMRIGMPFYRYLVFAPLELVIWIIEAVVYRKRLQTRRETAHPIAYALCANALSAAAIGTVKITPKLAENPFMISIPTALELINCSMRFIKQNENAIS